MIIRFDDFSLDVPGRQLWKGTQPVDLNGKYFDALVLLLQEHGQLVTKDRFFGKVWADVIVSDSALTQCIKEIRKQLGDDAANPRYVQTVPRYGYRFVGQVEISTPEEEMPQAVQIAISSDGPTREKDRGIPERSAGQQALLEGTAGMLGGGAAGLLGGLFYGMVTARVAGGGMGTLSTLIVFGSLGTFIGIAGGLGVSYGMAAAAFLRPGKPLWSVLGAVLGGAFVGSVANLVGVDAFNLLFGRTPAAITGPLEGAVVGAALALGVQWGRGTGTLWRSVLAAGTLGAGVGSLIPLLGGQLFAGSLQALVRAFSGSRLQLDALGGLFGDARLGQVTQAILGGIEASLFCACVAAAILLARHNLMRADTHASTT